MINGPHYLSLSLAPEAQIKTVFRFSNRGDRNAFMSELVRAGFRGESVEVGELAVKNNNGIVRRTEGNEHPQITSRHQTS